MQMFSLTGQTALITGSSRGLGQSLAIGLAQAGAKVIIHGSSEQSAADGVKALADRGIDAIPLAFDIRKEEQAQGAAAHLSAKGICPTILVNNAGINLRGSLTKIDAADWTKVIQTNLDGAFHVTRAFVPPMLEAGRGKIINICSLTSTLSRTGIAPYATAKGGMQMLTRSMAVEWAGLGLNCNGIAPGFFATDMNLALVNDNKFDTWLCERTPARRWGKPEELIGGVIYLAAPASDFVNGHVLAIDGGFLAAM
jgi:gluconate 5-dehydrogenase